MKRISKIVFAVICSVFLLSIRVCAFENNIDEYSSEFDYDSIIQSLDDETLEILEEIGIDEISLESLFSVNIQKVFNALLNIVDNSIKKPLKFTMISIGILMLTTIAENFSEDKNTLSLIGGGALSLTMAVPIATVVSTAFSVLESLLVFTTAFSGVFCAIVSSSGNVSMGASYATFTMFANTIFSGLLSNLSQPVINVLCVTGFLSCFDIYNFTERVSLLVKKVYVFVLSFTGTVFSGLVTLKGVLSNGVDNLSSRSIRFVIGQSLPIVGGAVSETYSTLIASLGLIKNTVGAFGIITVVVFVLPTLIELFMWLLSLEISLLAAHSFGVQSSVGMLNILKDALVLLVATITILTTIFVICVGVCLAVKAGEV